MFRGLGQIRLPKVSVQLINKLTPIIANGWFWECNQNWLPPQHGDVREVRCCIGHLLSVSCKLMRPTIKGHDTANYERAQFRWVLTSELVRLSSFGFLLTVTMWTCVVLLVGWPQAWWVADQVQLHRGQIVIGHQAPATKGLSKVLWWYCWRGDWGHDWSGRHWKWCCRCWLSQCHWGWWPRLCCWPDWGVHRLLLGCS